MACEDSGLIVRLKRGVTGPRMRMIGYLVVAANRTRGRAAIRLALEPACPQAGQDVDDPRNVWRRAARTVTVKCSLRRDCRTSCSQKVFLNFASRSFW